MSENNQENDNFEAHEPDTAEVVRDRTESMTQLLQSALNASRERQSNDQPDPLLSVLSVFNTKSVDEWRESEYARVLSTLQGITGTETQTQLADGMRSYILQKVTDNQLDEERVVQESTAQTQTDRTFEDVTRNMVNSLLSMTVAQRDEKKGELLYLASQMTGPKAKDINAALTLLNDVETIYTNRTINDLEANLSEPSLYPSTGNTEFDREFPNILRAYKNALSQQELMDIYEASKDTILRRGTPQHRVFLNQLREKIAAVGSEEANAQKLREHYGERERRIAREKEMPYKPEDRELYAGTIDQTIDARMRRILDQDPAHPIGNDEMRQYFSYLQRWVGKVLRNDKLLNSRDGTLELDAARRDMFIKIRDANKGDNEITLAQLKEYTKYLQDENGGRLTRYFKRRIDEDSKTLVGNDRIEFIHGTTDKSLIGSGIRDDEGPLEGRIKDSYLPETLDEIVELLEEQYGQNWDIKVGDEHELIDVDGNFHYENFVTFVRAQANYLEGENPKGEIDPLSSIRVKLPMGEVSMTEIVYSDQFRRQKRFKISGSDKDEESIFGHWGEKEEHPDFKRYQAEVLLYETGYFAKGHNSTATWLEKAGSADGFKQEVNKFNIDGFISRGNWTVFAQAGSRITGDDREFKVGEKDSENDGTVGRAMREMMIAYSHLTDFTEFHTYKKGDPRIGTQKADGTIVKVGDSKAYEHSTFYRYLEANGTSAFLHGITEAALDNYGEAKGIYSKFIQSRIAAASESYIAAKPDLTEEQKMQLAQLQEQFVTGMNNGHRDYRHRLEFNRNELLLKFHKKARQIIEYGPYNKEALNKEIRDDMLSHLNEDFFKEVMDIKVYNIDTDSNNGSRIPTQRQTGEKEKKLGTVKFGDVAFSDIVKTFMEQNTIENYDKNVDYDFEKDNGPDTNSADFKKYLAANEKMALAAAQILGNTKRRDLNYYLNTDHDSSKEYLVDIGIRKAIAEKAFKLEDIEAEYSWRYAKNYLKPLGIGGTLDTNGVGYDFWTRLTRPDKYLERQLGRGYPVIHHLLHEYHGFGLNMLDMIEVRKDGEKVKEHSMASIFEGREGMDIKKRKDRKITDTLIIEPGAQRNVLQNHIDNSINFINALKKGDFDFAKMFHKDFRGYPIFDKEGANKLVGDLWKMIRYSTDQTGIDYSRVINKDGVEQDILHHLFGPKTRTILEVMQKEVYKDDPKRPYTNPGIGVMATLIGAVIEEHRNDPGEHRWNIQQIKQIEYVFARATKDKKVQFTPKVFDSMLRMYKTDFKRMYNFETLWALFSTMGILFGTGLGTLIEEIPQKK